VLHIEKGIIEVEFYGENGDSLGKRVLNSNDTILLVSGGHGFNILEDCRILEIKQGPYKGVDMDKKHLGSDKGD